MSSAQRPEPSHDVCARFGVSPAPPDPWQTVGIHLPVRADVWPLNGLRHPPDRAACGWYLWRGRELSAADDFFSPLHVAHISDYEPAAAAYLALAPGWRFLIAPGYEDVWFDDALLHPQ